MTTDKNTTNASQFISDNSLIIAMVPLLGYLLAYAYDSGYLSYCDVPSIFIQVDLVRVLKASLAVALALFLLVCVVGFARVLLLHAHPFWRIVGKAVVIGIFLGLLLVLDISATQNDLKRIGGLMGIFILLDLIPPAFSKIPDKNYWKNYWVRVSSQLDSDAKSSSLDKNASFLSKVIGFSILILFSFMFVNSLGMREAKSQTDWWVLKDRPDMLIVTTYGDTVILKKINPTTKETMDDVEIIKISESNPLKITLASLGEINTKTLQHYKKKS